MKLKKKIIIFVIVITLILSASVLFVLFGKESRLLYCSNYEKIEIDFVNLEISELQIDAYIDEIKKDYSELQVLDKQIVENGDVVNLDCKVYKDGVLIDSITKIDVMIGTYNFNRDVEDFIIGKKIKTTLLFTVGNSTYEVVANQIKKFVFPGFTEEFLVKNYNVTSYSEFRNKISDILYDEQYFFAKKETQQEIVEKIINQSIFFLNDDDVDIHYQQRLEYYKNLSDVYGVTFEEYIYQYEGMSVDEFAEKCYNESVIDLKTELVVEYIWNQMDVTEISNSIVDSGVKNTSIDDLSSAEIRLIVYNYLFNLTIK